VLDEKTANRDRINQRKDWNSPWVLERRVYRYVVILRDSVQEEYVQEERRGREIVMDRFKLDLITTIRHQVNVALAGSHRTRETAIKRRRPRKGDKMRFYSGNSIGFIWPCSFLV